MDETTTTMKTVIEDIVGVYESSFETVATLQADETYLYESVEVPDYAWIGGLLMLLVLTYSFFRAIGGLIRCKT